MKPSLDDLIRAQHASILKDQTMSRYEDEDRTIQTIMRGVKWVGAGALFVTVASLAGCPTYNVYQQEMSGRAELARAESTRRTKVLEAQAELDSAGLKATAEVRRAEGVAQANKILADSLGGPEGYLRWKYIQMLEDTGGKEGREVIYIPTEGAMPILEAGRAVKGPKQ